jgi:putative CocE/NonD family hydrolase
MHRSPWLSRIALALGGIVVLVAAVIVIVKSGKRDTPPPPKVTGVASDKQVKIPVDGGVKLAAEVVTPLGSGKFPLVVMPTAFGSKLTQYHGLVGELARDGYEIVTYTQRGFLDSGGEVDFAAPPTQRDVSKIIGWAVGHLPVDAAHIGMFGTSYGAGVSLLAAAHDKRIKAVVATSSWADFAGVFDTNHTPSLYSLGLLLGTAAKKGRPGADLKRLKASAAAPVETTGNLIESMTKSRSADELLPDINAHHPAIMLASAYSDSILPPLSLVSFFDRLTGPKRLQLAPGDHGTPEASGLLGLPNATTDAARKWLDHYLKSTANGIDTQPPVHLEDAITHEVHTFDRWPSAGTTLSLARPNASGNAKVGSPETWSADLGAGADTSADSGVPTYAPPYRPDPIALSDVDSTNAMTWTGAPVDRDTVLAGLPTLALDVSSSVGTASLFAYLYDVDSGGKGSLMSVTPYTVTDAQSAKHISFSLSPVGWTLTPGHKIALVVDTVDPRWRSASVPGSRLTVSSTATEPARLSIPIQP